MARYLYSELSSLLGAINNIQNEKTNDSRRFEWEEKHRAKAMKLTYEYMPCGSGFDQGTSLDFDQSHKEKLVFVTSFHHTNEVGMHDGWTEHVVTVTPSFDSGMNLRISGRNRNLIKDCIYEAFFNALQTDLKPIIEAERAKSRRKQAIAKQYTSERKLGFRAEEAYRNAVTRYDWSQLESDDSEPEEIGAVRLKVIPDNTCVEDLEGDMFNADVNGISEDRNERERKEFIERINNDGIWGIVSEVWDGSEWQHADSCFGFVGDEWKNSGTDIDVMIAALEMSKQLTQQTSEDRKTA